MVLLLQLGFIVSFVGAFHAPHPHRIPVEVVGSAPVGRATVDALDAVRSSPVHASVAVDLPTARDHLASGVASGVYIPDPMSTHDTLLIADAGGTSVGTALTKIFFGVATQRGRTLTIHDAVPLQPGDGNGLTGFYLVVGWIIGGYLLAAVLGVVRGAKMTSARTASRRLVVVVLYALASGFLGAVIVGPILVALHTGLLELTLLGALAVFASAATTIALQAMLGIVGIAVTIIVFVILGNPSAGGAYQAALLPPFWRAISAVIPNGAGTDAVRKLVYFHGHGVMSGIWVLIAYILVGTTVAILLSHRRSLVRPDRNNGVRQRIVRAVATSCDVGRRRVAGHPRLI
ncbi:YhgE/Pip domain-containing protein [Williamsia deligens]|uniref:DUF3533 domain-containing protein n=1 Tax=Williamsia deligens TaxID=321325 RepID=A0ABW3GD25_9NOCA|nr:DUF3533 domain-containing protein [Williamsia deligens]